MSTVARLIALLPVFSQHIASRFTARRTNIEQREVVASLTHANDPAPASGIIGKKGHILLVTETSRQPHSYPPIPSITIKWGPENKAAAAAAAHRYRYQSLHLQRCPGPKAISDEPRASSTSSTSPSRFDSSFLSFAIFSRKAPHPGANHLNQ
jgi:hypothetical protein